MKQITALLVDDELIARKVLNHLLREHPTVQIVGEAACLDTAVQLANQHKPDLIFLDIQLSESQSGFSLLDHLSFQPHIVFVTAHDIYAIRAFDVHALDYILKPVDPKRLALTLDRVQQTQTSMAGQDDVIFLRDCNRMHLVYRDKIVAIVSDSSFTHVHRIDADPLFIRRGIGEWEKSLPTPPFVRLDRSLIINTQHTLGLKVVTRDKSLLQMRGKDNEFILRRVALGRFRKLRQDLGLS